MKVVVLGAGVVGVSTACFLARDGHVVTVLDARAGAGLEISFANGGQLSVSHPEPWASPRVPGLMARALVDRSAPLRLRPSLDLSLWGWGLRFLRNCAAARRRRHTPPIARVALYSRCQLAAVQDNAVEWAAARIELSVASAPKRLEISVEADGPGVPGELLEAWRGAVSESMSPARATALASLSGAWWDSMTTG